MHTTTSNAAHTLTVKNTTLSGLGTQRQHLHTQKARDRTTFAEGDSLPLEALKVADAEGARYAEARSSTGMLGACVPASRAYASDMCSLVCPDEPLLMPPRAVCTEWLRRVAVDKLSALACTRTSSRGQRPAKAQAIV